MPQSRSDCNIPKLWIRTVQSQNRIRLSREDGKNIVWLDAKAGFSVNCIAKVGSHGQLQIMPEQPGEGSLKAVAAPLSTDPESIPQYNESWLEFARYNATSWQIQISFEAENGRFTFMLPREARELNIVPHEKEPAAIFSTGILLEIWKASDWIEHVKKLSTAVSGIAEKMENFIQSLSDNSNPTRS